MPGRNRCSARDCVEAERARSSLDAMIADPVKWLESVGVPAAYRQDIGPVAEELSPGQVRRLEGGELGPLFLGQKAASMLIDAWPRFAEAGARTILWRSGPELEFQLHYYSSESGAAAYQALISADVLVLDAARYVPNYVYHAVLHMRGMAGLTTILLDAGEGQYLGASGNERGGRGDVPRGGDGMSRE